MKKLPVGMQTFADIIRQDYLYVDKTQLIAALLDSGKYLFLSRPRRFGKSLLVSTLAEIFAGQQSLFKGLAIYDQIQWHRYPIIQLDFAAIDFDAETGLQAGLITFLDKINRQYQLNVPQTGFSGYFYAIIEALYLQSGNKVVVLIDEYDKPIVEYIEHLDTAVAHREILRRFFGVLKSADRYLHFVFLTGVSKFSKVSMFSELNNVRDITLSPQFASLTGYTQAELDTYFAPYIQHCATHLALTEAELLAKIKTWYNGYSWDAQQQVYNPFSILMFFTEQQFDNYWFASGTPTFLTRLIKTQTYTATAFEHQTVPKMVFDSYNLEEMDVFALLFQTGYLTITQVTHDEDFVEYTLNYPNAEVKQAFITCLFAAFTDNPLKDIRPAARQLRACLQAQDIDGFMRLMRALFAKIPYPLHLEQEAYYHSLFYMIAVLMGIELDLEVLTDKGRIDGVLYLPDKIYLLEFKYGKSGTAMRTLTQRAIRQLRTQQYAERFLTDPRPCWLFGIGFVEKRIGYELARA